jgi:hypothetical protein
LTSGAEAGGLGRSGRRRTRLRACGVQAPWSNDHGKEGVPASQGSGRRSGQGDKEEPGWLEGIPDTRGYPPGAGACKNFCLRAASQVGKGWQRGYVLTVKIRQPSHEFTFGVGIRFIPYPLVLTPVV